MEEVGEATRAGATCGSCRPEMARIIAALPPQEEEDGRNAA
jgi:NAD(P)H-nitrite reductase large subunit